MTYRKQLYLVLLLLVVLSTSLFAAASYRVCNYLLRREVHRKVHSVASTAVLLLDPASIATVTNPGDEAKAQYAQVLRVLNAVRNANRRDDIWVDHLWTLVPAPGHADLLVYGVDTGQDNGAAHRPGDRFEVSGRPGTLTLESVHHEDDELDNFQISYDTGFAPIYDKSGRLVAELGVKLGWAPDTMLGNVWRYILPPFIFTVGLAMIMAMILSREVTGPLYRLREAIETIGKGNLGVSVEPRGTIEFVDMARAINSMSAGLRERETIKQAFSGYLSHEILDLIIRNGKLPELKGERRRITVLFADVRNFTTMSETKAPEEVVELMSKFFERMVEVVQRNHGMVDKFTGDGMMVIFGAPVEDLEHERHAVISSIEMQQALEELRNHWEVQGRPGFRMGIGINSGSAVVGNIGSQAHMEYTAIGDTVNLAARLQDATKEFGAEIVISKATHDAIQSGIDGRRLGELQVKGRLQSVEVYCVDGVRRSPAQ
jgi:adenylate cyclase